MAKMQVLSVGVVLVHVCSLAGCASGTGHVESLLRSIYPVDAAVVGASALLLYGVGSGWRTSVVQSAERRYRIAVVRSPWPAGGDGEFAGRFTREAQRVATEQACAGFRVLAYAERYEVINVFFNGRVGEGEIECLEGRIEKATARPFVESPMPVSILPDTARWEGVSDEP